MKKPQKPEIQKTSYYPIALSLMSFVSAIAWGLDISMVLYYLFYCSVLLLL